MSSIDVPLKSGRFPRPSLAKLSAKTIGGSSRWWYSSVTWRSSSTRTTPSSKTTYYEVTGTGYLSPMYSPLLFRDAPSWWPALIPYSAAWFILWAPAGIPLHLLLLSRRLLQRLGGPIRFPAPWASRARPTGASASGRCLFRTSTATFSTSRSSSSSSWPTTPGRRLWFDGPNGPGTQFGIGLASLILIVNPIFLGLYTFGCHSFRHLIGGRQGRSVGESRAEVLLRLRLRPESQPHEVGLDQHVLRGLRRSVHPPVRQGHLDGLEDSLSGGISGSRIRRPGDRRGRRRIARGH